MMMMRMWVRGTVVASIVIAINIKMLFIHLIQKAFASSSFFILHPSSFILSYRGYINTSSPSPVIRPRNPRQAVCFPSYSPYPPNRIVCNPISLINIIIKEKKKKERKKGKSQFLNFSNVVTCVCMCMCVCMYFSPLYSSPRASLSNLVVKGRPLPT